MFSKEMTSTWERTQNIKTELTFPFNKAAPNISKKRRNTDIYVERKYISKPIIWKQANNILYT